MIRVIIQFNTSWITRHFTKYGYAVQQLDNQTLEVIETFYYIHRQPVNMKKLKKNSLKGYPHFKLR